MKTLSFERTWIPSNELKKPTHTLWIYDAGELQGFLLEDQRGKNEFTLYKHQSREYKQDGCIQETGTIEYCVPKDYFSIESYPCAITLSPQSQPQTLWIPQWKIQISLSASDSPVQTSSYPPQPPPSSRQPPRQQPLPLRQPKHQLPALPAHPKSHLSKREQSQRNERSTKNTSPRPTSSPSSNPTSHVQQPRPNPRKPVSHHPQPSSKKQSVPSMPSSSLPLTPQRPPSSQPPQEHA